MSYLIAGIVVALFAQDRADVTGSIDTWYRVTQGRKPVGFVHESLLRTSKSWRYEYSIDSEFELSFRDRTQAEDLVAGAYLDETFMPVEFSAVAHANDVRTGLKVADRRVALSPAAGEALGWVLPAKEDLHLLPTLTFYALRQNETLSKAGRVTLRVLDPRGVEKAGVEVVLEVGEPLRREFLGRDVWVTPVAFLKPFPAASRETELKDAFVDRYGRILEATMVGGAKITIAAQKDAALEGLGILHRHGRRDPFDGLTARENGAAETARARRGGATLVPPVVTLDTLMSDLSGAKQMIDEARAQKAAGDSEDARKTYLKALVHLKAIRALAARARIELLPQIDQARDDAELAWDGAAQVEREARGLFVQVKPAMDALDLAGLERIQQELGTLRERIEVEQRPERDQIAAWAADTGLLIVRCRTRLELARTRVDVSGITTTEVWTIESANSHSSVMGFDIGVGAGVPFMRPVRMADINGKTYRIGDILDGTQVRVERITRQGVQVSLREELRDVGLRR